MRRVIFNLLSFTATKIYQLSAKVAGVAEAVEALSLRLDFYAANFYDEIDESLDEIEEPVLGV